MKTLILYDSYFGNTKIVAECINKNIVNSNIKHISEFNINDIKDIELLIVGSPTRAFTYTDNVKKFLNNLPKNSLKGINISSFDTRVDITVVNNKFLTFMVNLFGYAAEPISKRLINKGGNMIIKPIGIFVKDKEGPLEDGYEDRIKDWVNSTN